MCCAGLLLPCYCLLLPCYCHATAMLLPCYCLLLPCYCHAWVLVHVVDGVDVTLQSKPPKREVSLLLDLYSSWPFLHARWVLASHPLATVLILLVWPTFQLFGDLVPTESTGRSLLCLVLLRLWFLLLVSLASSFFCLYLCLVRLRHR